MITYDFSLCVTNNDNKRGQYQLQFKDYEEDNPEQKFTPEVRENMRRKLQKETQSKINESNLDKMIQSWIQDIREGFRNTSLNINLPSLLTDGINLLEENGNQNLPGIIPPPLSEIEPQIGCFPPLNFV